MTRARYQQVSLEDTPYTTVFAVVCAGLSCVGRIITLVTIMSTAGNG